MKKILFILLLTIPFIGFGQGWEKTFGGNDEEDGKSVQQTTDGGYIICGKTQSFGNGDGDVYLIKTDGNGIEQWNNTFGGTSWEMGRSVQQTSDGGYIICGETLSSGIDMDVYLIKTNGNGIEQWNKTFGGTSFDFGNSVQQTTDGGYVITGSTESFGNRGVYLIKTDVNGDSLWTKTFFGGGMDQDQGHSVQQTNDGGYIISGITYSFGNGDGDDYLIKTDGNGDSLWTKTFGGTGRDKGSSVQQTNDGGYIITGSTESFGNGEEDVYLIKTDGNGDSLWTKTFGGTGRDKGSSVQQTSDGGYIITGSTESFGNGEEDVYLIKTDVNGDSLWTKTFGGSDEDEGHSVQQTSDGGYIISGRTYSFGNGEGDVYLIKTDSQGNVTSTFNIPTTSSNRKLKKVIDILGRDVKPQTNTPFIEIYDDGSVEKKIVIE